MVTDHYHTYKFGMKHFYMLKITNVATVRHFEVLSDKFNVVDICTNGNYE